MSTFKTCPRCLALKEWVKAHVPCFCWAHGNIIEDAIETARNYAHEAPGLMFGALRRQVAIEQQRKTHNAKLTGDPQLHRGASSEQSERG